MAGFGAPLFMILSGISYRLWLNGQLCRGKSESHISKVTIRRGLFLFGLGFLFNVLVWLPEDTFNWDVLTLIGVGLMILNLARNLPRKITLTFCAAVMAISPLSRSLADWSSYWTEGYFDPDMTLSDVLQGFLVVGYFPVLPWIIYPLIGFVTGTSVFGASRDQIPDVCALRRGLFIGGGLILTALAAVLIRVLAPQFFPDDWPAPWTMFPPSPEYVIGTIGFGLFSFCGSFLWLDQGGSPGRFRSIRNVAATFSRHSLSAYILHHAAHLWPLWIYGVSQGNEPTHYWRQLTSVPVAVALSCLFLPGCYLLFRWMDKTNKHGIESWMRWICD